MSLIFGRRFIVRHQEGITHSDSAVTSASASTAKGIDGWQRMYQRDKYARDRVMKSARLLLPFLKDGETILDVGCYTHEAKKYFPRTVKYIGLDVTAFHAQTQVVDLNHGFSPVPCSHALCLETLEHLIDPEDTLESLSKSVSDSGAIVVSLPNESTLFHRIRCLCGTVDAGCFSAEGKHLHLPSLKQSRAFLSKWFDIVLERYYIAPSAVGSSHQWLGRILCLIPDGFHQWIADKFPSLFARGFIFLLKKKGDELVLANPDERATFLRPELKKQTAKAPDLPSSK